MWLSEVYVCQTGGGKKKINALLRERLRLHKPTAVLTAEQESVKDINLNISHAWGTPHEENKAAHPCISWGTKGGFLRKGVEWVIMPGYHLSGDVMWAGCRLTRNQTRAEIVGPVKPETCTLQHNPSGVTPHFT